jgi:parallel beta-helix repeat protein
MNKTAKFFYRRAVLETAILAAIAAVLGGGPSMAATLVVKPGESIQAAVARAATGDRVEVYPGTYHETVYIDRDGINLQGIVEGGKWPVLDGESSLNDGILVSGHGVTIERMWVRRYKGNAIMTQGANNYRILRNVVEGPCFYAIFPQFGKNGLVAYNVVHGSDDAAIYIGMSEGVDVIHNESYASIIGIESENSRNILIADNFIHDNVMGIATTLLPGLPVKSSDNLIIRSNYIVHNNAKNWAPPGAITAGAIPGVGVLILGTDHTVVDGNIIRDHDSAGLVIAETNFFVPTPDDKMDPFPDSAQLLRNVFLDNGSQPAGAIKDLLEAAGLVRGVDVFGTGKGHDNCVAERSAITSLGINRYADCTPEATSATVLSMRPKDPVVNAAYTPEQKGRLTYLAVCTGCHTYDSKLIGPPMVVVKALYGKDALRLAEWIAKPTHKRPDYPEMPPQNYLPEDVRLAVANYILNELSH